ncbi:LacI family DNA-binding transcriptional regulator [Niveispirillum sp. BGYR6]|uniref:LacI family DNA-binding transcriptional regulator n=1 Tax=Niveispirillum sp. BGYR6 TaxID=2971249 RepID=UPI0022B9938F|nr:LacI family DNA-binding transcriptional regulator [Niveispirillum sp. BGYR6]
MTKPTIHDVARAAGVSIKTVSRVLNGEPKASAATREKVMEAVSALNYSPNLSARSLSGLRNYMMAFVLGGEAEKPSLSLQNEYIAALQVGAVTAAKEAGYHLLVEPLGMAAEGFKERARRMIAMPAVDGFIFMPGLADHPDMLELLIQRPGTYVRVSPGRDVPSLPATVRINDYQAAFDMTRHLLDLGHRRIAFVQGLPGYGSAELRFEAFRDAMAQVGGHDPALLRPGAYSLQSGREAAESLLSLPTLPTAIFAANDAMAMGVMAVAHRRGIRVPDQLSVAGIDDIPMAAAVWPTLTTVRQPLTAMGAAAAQYIIARSQGRHDTPPPATFRHELVVRESTAPPQG